MSSILGLPLEILLYELDKHNMIVDWVEFFESSKKHGWKEKTTLQRISVGVFEVYGPKYRDIVINRLKKYIEHSS